MAGAGFRENIAGWQNVEFFHTKCIAKMGQVSSPKRQAQDYDFMVGSVLDPAQIACILAETTDAIFLQILNSQVRGRRNSW